MKSMKIEVLLIHLLFLSSIINCHQNQPIHKCMHDELENQTFLKGVVINKDEKEKRRQDEATEPNFKDFNIVIDFENIKNDIEKYNLKDMTDFYISSMTKAVDTLKSLLKVKPLDSSKNYYLSDATLKALNLTKWDKSMFGDETITKRDSFQKLGIDLAIFGTITDQMPESTLATASAKIRQESSNYQPYVGFVKINRNIDYSKPNSQIYFESILAHEFTHILGFSIQFFQEKLEIIEKADSDNIMRRYLNSPKLLEVAKKYYNCDSIEGVELENEGGTGTAGSHWEARILLGEYMNGYAYTEEQVISEFTLAVLEDLGYYQANYYTGGLMQFGRNKGCEFLYNKCVDKATHKINETFENEFFDTISGFKSIEASCSSGRQSRAYKAWYQASDLPELYQYFLNTEIVGYQPADYCPVFQKFTEEEELSYFAGHCSIVRSLGYGTQIQYGNSINPTSGNLLDYTGESFTEHSFCYLSSLSTNNEISKVVRANCYETFCSDRSLTLKIFDDYIVCPRAGGKIKVKGYSGYLLCPDYNLICSGKIQCNNIFDCVDMKSEIKENSYTYDYISKTSQNIEKADSAEFDTIDNYELSENGMCKQYCKHCNNNKCQDCAAGYVLKMEDNRDINCYQEGSIGPEYYKNSNNIYVKCMDNCLVCDDMDTCKKCKENYKYVPDQKTCVELTEEEQKKMKANCLQYDDEYNCVKCQDGYAFKKGEEGNICHNIVEFDEYYSKDNGISYIPCSSYNETCQKCYYAKDEYRVKCTSCKNGLILLEKGKGICMTLEEIKNTTKYYLVNQTNARECKKDIENCVSCDSADNCLKCKYNYDFDIAEKKCLEKVKSKTDDGSIISGNGGSKESSTTTSTKTDSGIKRRKVKKSKNNSNYFSIANVLLLQTLYIILILIKF